MFNVTVVNSQSDGYDIPASLSGYPNFDFKVRIAMFVKEKCIQPIDLFLSFKYFVCLICRFFTRYKTVHMSEAFCGYIVPIVNSL